MSCRLATRQLPSLDSPGGVLDDERKTPKPNNNKAPGPGPLAWISVGAEDPSSIGSIPFLQLPAHQRLARLSELAGGFHRLLSTAREAKTSWGSVMHPTLTACERAELEHAPRSTSFLPRAFSVSFRCCPVALSLGFAMARADDMRGMEKCGEKPALGVLDPSWQLMRELANSLLGRTAIHDNARLGGGSLFPPSYHAHTCGRVLMDEHDRNVRSRPQSGDVERECKN